MRLVFWERMQAIFLVFNSSIVLCTYFLFNKFQKSQIFRPSFFRVKNLKKMKKQTKWKNWGRYSNRALETFLPSLL